ncbi:MAG TPA: FKBP-type peptidyl-prolyl cis-trans isomerase [Anaeromyxobacter sp.]
MRLAPCLALALALAASPALAADAPPTPDAKPPAATAPAAPKPPSPAELEKTLYGVGLAVAKSLEVFALAPAELEAVLRGIKDGWSGKPKAQLDPKMQQAVNELARARAPKAQEKAAAREKEQGAAYLAKRSKEKGVKKSPSGALVFTEKEGTGAVPTATDKVKVNYTGTLVSGAVFDSSANRGPAEFPVAGVIKCWTEVLQMMKVGGKTKVVCPSDIAYGPNGNAGIPGNAVLTFEIELLDVVK